jgi:ATP-binding cassette subfamily F protein uup
MGNVAGRTARSSRSQRAWDFAAGDRGISAAVKKKLSYLEAREYASIEDRVAAAEQVLESKRSSAEDPAIATDAARLLSAHAELEAAQKDVDELYSRWAELEKKQA